MNKSLIGIKILPLGGLTFKPPTPFAAGVHGPGSYGTSLSYPPPSTISGMLSGIAYNMHKCADLDTITDLHVSEPFADTILCLKNLLGEGFKLYTGFLSKNDDIYAYINKDVFPRLDTICPCKNILKTDNTMKAVRHRLTGISLDRRSKNVNESMLYSIERVSYTPQSHITIIAETEDHGIMVKDSSNSIVKLGSKTGIGKIEVTQDKGVDYRIIEPGDYCGVLVSPAIIEENPFNIGTVIVSNKKVAEKLMQSLIKDSEIKGSGYIVEVPKGEYEFSVYNVGWSLKFNKPRPPKLIIPPGTRFYINIEHETELLFINKYSRYLAGLGAWNRLGWGTTILCKVEKREDCENPRCCILNKLDRNLDSSIIF